MGGATVRRAFLGVLASAVVAAGAAASAPPVEPPLARLLAQAQDLHGRFVGSSPDELLRAERLFVRFLSGERGPAVAGEAHALGLELTPCRDAVGCAFLLVREAGAARRGRGAYAFRPRGAPGPLLVAPHCFYDRSTGGLVRELFLDAPFAAAAWNTVPRWAAGGGPKGPADTQAHPENWLAAFARAAASSCRDRALVQLHGFATGKRSAVAGREAGLIVSSGTGEPSTSAVRLAAALRVRFPGLVRLYPSDVDELGALGNVSGALFRAAGHAGFLHVELSGDVRGRLTASAATRRALAEALMRPRGILERAPEGRGR